MAWAGASAAINLGMGMGASVLELIGAIERVPGQAVNRSVASRRPGDPAVLVVDSAHAKSLLGWTPKYDLSSIVTSAWRWRQKERDKILAQAPLRSAR